MGELWAAYFDGETQQHVAVKNEFPFRECTFDTDDFHILVGNARLDPGHLSGSVASGGHTVSWTLGFSGEDQPLFLLPKELYDAPVPQAKSLVSLPLAVYNGALQIDGCDLAIEEWVGSQNHNWGLKHTDHYAWGQVAGFDTDREAFLEVATARLRVGSDWSPFMTPVVLRHRGREISLNALSQIVSAEASFSYFEWTFKSAMEGILIEGCFTAPREAFVGLRYGNPPGGTKECLNTKIASCELRVTYQEEGGAGRTETLSTSNRAAFEILTDDQDHGVEIYA